MIKRTAIKTTIPEIVDYWFSRVYEGDLSVDASEGHERCWRCGYQTKLECCHIIPIPAKGQTNLLIWFCYAKNVI